MAQLDIAEWYYRDEQYRLSLEALTGIDDMMVDNLDMQLQYSEKRYLIHHALGQYKEAYIYSERHSILKDSMRQQEVSTQISALLEQKNKAERSNKIALLKADTLKYQLRSRTILFASLAFALMLGLIAYWWYVKHSRRIDDSEKAVLQMEQRLFRSQMNPHFIFNTLGSIQSFLLDKNKSKEAAYYIAKFSKLMRQILSQSQRSAIPLQEELDTLNNYLLLQKMRFQDKFDYQIELDQTVKVDDINIPPMLLQPVVENAIEHGKIHLLTDGLIQVAFKMKGELLQVEISDNGVGIKKNQSSNSIKDKDSVALQIIKERLAYLSDKFDQNINLIFGQPKLGKGTTVIFNLPSL